MENEKIIDRIAEHLKEKKISFNECDALIGSSSGYIGKMIRARGSIGLDMFENFMSVFPEINAEWITRGVGAKYKELDTSQKIIITEENKGKIISEIADNRIIIHHLKKRLEDRSQIIDLQMALIDKLTKENEGLKTK